MKSSSNALLVLLLASAAILSIMWVVSEQNTAEAAIASDRAGDWIMVTGARRDSNDLLYVINVPYQRMVVYDVDEIQGRITIVDTIDLSRVFRNR
jgi:hypothetical protein